MSDAEIVIGIRGDISGGRTVERTLDDVARAGDRAQGGMNRLQTEMKSVNSVGQNLTNMFKGLIAAYGLRELQQTVDTYTNMQNRLRLVTNSTAELASVTNDLFTISNATRQSFTSVAELYSRVSLATKTLGLTTAQTLQFTQSLSQAVALSGASAVEAENAIIQLSQGLASGALRGDELRSVLEQLPSVADVIAKGLGVTRGELRKMGEDGAITAEMVIEAFAKARVELNDKFGKTVPTIGQAFVVLKNTLIEFVGGVDQATGASGGLAQGLINTSQVLSDMSGGFQAIIKLVKVGALELKQFWNDIEVGWQDLHNKFQLRLEKMSGGLYKAKIQGDAFKIDYTSQINEVLYANPIKLRNPNQPLENVNKDSFVYKTPEINAVNSALETTKKHVTETSQKLPEIDDGMDRLIKQTDKFAESAADAFGSFVDGSKTAKEALASLVGDLQRVLIQETVTNPLSDALRGILKGSLGGGSSNSSGGGFLSSILGGVKSIFGFDSGGSMILGGRPGIDQNVLSLNGAPIANVGRGEVLSISPDRNGGGSGVTVYQTLQISTGVAETVAAEFATMLPKIQEATKAAINEDRLRGVS